MTGEIKPNSIIIRSITGEVTEGIPDLTTVSERKPSEDEAKLILEAIKAATETAAYLGIVGEFSPVITKLVRKLPSE